ncbi:MAG: hypothetical protein ACKOTH_05485, partial [Solirubrobacterales bacterium]
MKSVVHIPWYATGFRGDKLESALHDVTGTSLRYGARSWAVHRNRDDRYKFLQIVEFESKLDFEAWWEGTEMSEFRTIASSWFAVPVLHSWCDLVGEGRIIDEPEENEGDSDLEPEP